VRAAYLAEVEQRLADAERERTERAEAAVGAERARIARELHDVVAHHVSLIGVQAGAARATLDRSPERARAALSSIEQSSREAVHEMHRLLHVLRPVGGEAPGSGAQLSPQPTLPDLPATAARWSQAGLEVSLQLTGPIDAVDPARSTCAYRIAEEALTNVSRHSSATAASVTVTVGDQVTVDVLDPGPARVTTSPGSGRGLVGMRERAAIFGGTVSAGQDGTGFRVTARLPRSTDG
jgi:signal transduction histidine kinase